MANIVQKKITKCSVDASTEVVDTLAVEEPLEIRISFFNGSEHIIKAIAITMRTPGNDINLALGFLYSENIISSIAQVEEVNHIPGKDPSKGDNIILVKLKKGDTPNLQNTERNFYMTSSCGICGKASIEAVQLIAPGELKNHHFEIRVDDLFTIPSIFHEHQSVFDRTGGLHAAALFDLEMNLVQLFEDVGRHNALDKLIGWAFAEKILPLDRYIVALSGRASFELIQKSAMAGLQLITAVGAPSSLAVELAEDFGMTLVGFLKESSLNIYSSPEKILLNSKN